MSEISLDSFQPLRLTQARLSKQFSKATLANHLNVTSEDVSIWESGQQQPDDFTLKALRQALDMPVHWFSKSVVDYGPGTYFFHCKSDNPVIYQMACTLLNWLAELSLTLQQWLVCPDVILPLNEQPFQSLSDREIEHLAAECRELAGTGPGPVGDVLLALENCGVHCATYTLDLPYPITIARWYEKYQRPCVLIGQDGTNGFNTRFETARALGHLVLHASVSIEDQQQNHNALKQQADLFAACFLMPRAFVKAQILWPDIDIFFYFHPRWKVSIKTLILRAHQIQIIDDHQKQELLCEYEKRGWKEKEPFDDRLPFESTRLLLRAIHILIDQSLINKTELLESLGLSDTLCERLCNLTPGYFQDHPPKALNLVELKAAGTRSFHYFDKPAQVHSLKKA